MRFPVLPVMCLAGCLAGGHAFAQAGDVPTRLSLAEALRLAVERNPSLDAARLQQGVAQADVAAAGRWLNPSFSVDSEGYNGEPSGAGFFDQQELALRVDQEFELGGRRKHRSTVAAAAAAATARSIDDQVRQLRFDVQQAYFQLVLARLDADFARVSLEEIDKVIAVNRSRYKQGEVSGTELRRLEVERLRFTNDALQADLANRHSRSRLLALMAAARLDQAVEPTDTLVVPPSGAPGADQTAGRGAVDSSALIAKALAERPDLQAAQQDQSRARAEVDLQHALRTPNLSVGGGYKRDFGTSGLVWGVSMMLPLFDRNAPGIARAEAGRRVTDSQARARALAVSLEVQQAVALVDVSRERVAQIEHDYLTAAREARDAVLSAYRAGEGDLLDYLDAQRAYRDLQRAYNRALLDYRLSLFQLDAAIGARPGDLLP
jgi:outer membrane protein, heavy metal efflux system